MKLMVEGDEIDADGSWWINSDGSSDEDMEKVKSVIN